MRILKFSLIFLLVPFLSVSQSYWKNMHPGSINGRSTPDILPEKYQSFSLNLNNLKQYLSQAPIEFSAERSDRNFTLELPMPDGTTEQFIVFKTENMEQGLASRYNSLSSYKGYSASDAAKIVRFDIGPFGFHGAVWTHDGLIYIDPFTRSSDEFYISYYTEDHYSDLYKNTILCGFDDEEAAVNSGPRFGWRSNADIKRELRVYRFALACTGEWGRNRGTVEKALADMVTMVNRANLIYEKELTIRMVLIENNDKIIFLDPVTDPYTDADKGRTILGQNTGVINTRIGSANYDIGHVLSVCFDVGGVANYGAMCSSIRANGVTCHNNNNIESIVVRVLSHEMGHQMTASHTFNRCGETDQLALGTAFEPGSGTTIMSYAGSCGSDNVSNNNDDYFHVASLDQMLSFTNSATQNAYNCAQKIDINNFVPEITIPYPNNFSIPKSTPFELTGLATDANGDNLTYLWEQFDNGASRPLGDPQGDCPLFRSVRPSTSPTRFFPSVSNIFANRLTEKNEFMPNYGRNLTFRFVVRDNNPMGGAVAWEEMKFKVAENAGPFKLIYPLLDGQFKVGQRVNIQWDVANTDVAPVNCKKVNIYLSIDGELRTPNQKMILLARETANDGAEDIIIPNIITTRARIVIKAADNVFLTTSLFNSRIQAPTVPAFFMDVDDSVKSSCLPDNVSYRFSTVGFGGLDKDIHFDVVSGLPEGSVVRFIPESVKPGEDVLMEVDLANVSGTNNYNVMVQAIAEGADTLVRTLQLNLTSTDLDEISSISPENGQNAVPPTQSYSWSAKPYADGYILEVASSPDFKPENILIRRDLTQNEFQSSLFLEKTKLFYWRVKAYNGCREGVWSDVSVFSTEAFSCFTVNSGPLAINISASGNPVIEATLNVFEEGSVNNVIVKKLRGEHQWVGDLVAFLVSPSGTEVMLWSRRCGSGKGVNITLDDQSPDFMQCPINTGRIFRPESPLAQFKGETIKGGWKVRIEDRASGNGGRLQEFNLEFCSDIAVRKPSFINNLGLQMPPNSGALIDGLLLKVGDDFNSPVNFKYTIVKSTGAGVLTINGNEVAPGSIFTQADIDAGRLRYVHADADIRSDYFTFTVDNGEGGWIGITAFDIEIDEDFPSSVNDVENEQMNWLIYPNPAAEDLSIRHINKNPGLVIAQITDMHGRILSQHSWNDESHLISVRNIPSGVYFIRVSHNSGSIVRKFIKR
jgi:subtilisin-like proprotein convertase family protein